MVYPVIWTHAVDLGLSVHEGPRVPVFDHHALGSSRRARCVDDVAEIPRAEAVAGGTQPALRGDRPAIGVDADDGAGERNPIRERSRGHERGGARIRQDVLDPVVGILRIDRHVCRTRLEDPEDGDVRIDRTWEQHRGDRPSFHTLTTQIPSESVRAVIQVRIRRRLMAEFDRDSARSGLGLFFEDPVKDLRLRTLRNEGARGRGDVARGDDLFQGCPWATTISPDCNCGAPGGP